MLGRRGFSLTIVLLVLALLLVVVSSVVRLGFGALHQAKLNTSSKQAFFCAEAGLSDGLRHLVEDPSWQDQLTDVPMPEGGRYSVEVTNNLSGSSVRLAGDGVSVPPRFAYLLATGWASADGVPRQAAVMVAPGGRSALGFALGVGGNVVMQGHKEISGSVKSNGDIRLGGNTQIVPVNNSGRLLSSSNIVTSGNSRMDQAQDVRARGSISSSPPIRDPHLVEASDTSESTLPFITDGRTTSQLSAGERGLVLPNPDRDLLFAEAVVHGENPPLALPSSFDTGGRVHLFPYGVVGAREVTGGGALVTTGGNSMHLGGGTVEASLIALRDGYAGQPSGIGGAPTISFQGRTEVRGLVYSHDGIEMQGNSTVVGLVICYYGDMHAQGNSTVTLDASVLSEVPGFATWAGQFTDTGGLLSGQGALGVWSWQRK